jgi:hypothetical protein
LLTLRPFPLQRQILPREFEGSPQGRKHCLAGCDSSLRITVRPHPLYPVDLLGHSSLAFEDMALSQRERIFSHLPSLIMVGLPLIHFAGQFLILFR